ncbi:MAG: CBS domain-containing protein [Bacteroidales bacterium]|nr:CBS domain-containing protein [Bacteroidales bacterium]
MKISASLYSSNNSNLHSLVRELDAYQSDWFHIDCNDDVSVFEDIKKIREFSNTPIDLHIISSDPSKYYDLIIETGVEFVTIQYEPIKKWQPLPSSFKGEFGIAITTGTDISVFKQFSETASFVLFMATTPGKSGESFQDYNFRKIRSFKNLFPDKKIHVDGGINAELSFILRNMGVYAIVVGSYLLKQEFIGSAMMKLRGETESEYHVCDFMLSRDESPAIINTEYSFKSLLQIIDNYKLGFTNIIDNNDNLLGIASMADIRKALLKNWDNRHDLSLENIINPNPITVLDSDTVKNMLKKIKSLSFPVLFLPVVDSNGKLVGTVKFNNLIKGEL